MQYRSTSARGNNCLRGAVIAAAIAAATAAGAATITVNSLADDVYMNAAGQTFSDAALTAPVAPAYCTLRMALAAANGNFAVGGCTAGSGADTIVFSGAASSGTITLSQVTMNEAPVTYGTSPPNWILAISSLVTITGPGSGALTISGGGFSPGSVGRRALLITDGAAGVDSPVSISGLRFKEGRSVPTPSASNPSVAVGSSGGCVFSRESLTLTDVIFENCEVAGYGDANVNTGAVGGALGVGAALATDARPNVTLNNVKFLGNRTVHGSANAASQSAAGAAALGNTTTLFVGAVSISNSQFIGNVSENVGAVRIQNASSVAISDTAFISNSSTVGADGAFNISNISGMVTLSNTGALGNISQTRRGAGQISTVGSGLTPADEVITISDSSFIGNMAMTQDIGGLSILPDTFDASSNCNFGQLRAVRLTNVYFERNIASQSRGGLRIGCTADVFLTGVEFQFNEVAGNSTASSGGQSAALIHDVANLTMTNTRIIGNRTYAGTTAGGYGVFTVLGAPSSSSVPSSWPLAHSVTATGLVVKDNWAQRNEAGLSLRPNGAGRNYLIADGAFIGNSAQGLAALLLDATGNYTVRNSTFSLNEATGNNGTAVGVNLHAASGTNSVNFINNTIARNRDGVNGDGAQMSFGAWIPGSAATPTPNGVVTLANNIVGVATTGSLVANGVFTPTGTGYNYAMFNNLFESSIVPSPFCAGAGMKCGVDARLDGLAFNGGSMAYSYTHRLLPGSPALDAGDNAAAAALTLDQRGTGFPRVVNSVVDIGALESSILAAVLPCKLDMDGDNQVRANKEGLVLLRSMLGFSGAAVVNGTGISQGQWDTARNNLNANCGTSFTP